MPNFKSISFEMTVLREWASPGVCYPKDPMSNRVNMISSTHLISSPLADHVHSFQCLRFQKIFQKKRRTLSQNTVKVTLMNRSPSGGKVCPLHINFKSPLKTVELQCFCNFWLISFSCYISVFELESKFWDLTLLFLNLNLNFWILF